MQPITSYHVISRHIMSYHVGQCCLYQMCSYLSGQCGGNVWGWKLHCILQICLKLGFKNLRRGTEPFPPLLSFEDQLLHLSMTCVQLIDLHCLSQPLLSLSLLLSVRRHPFEMTNFTIRTMTAPWHHLHPFALELFIKVANVEAKPPDCRLCQC